MQISLSHSGEKITSIAVESVKDGQRHEEIFYPKTKGEELKMEKGLAVIGEGGVATADQVKAQADLIHEVMCKVMKKKHHYGIIPGCGDKPTLLKPGAEKLMSTFKLAADPQVMEVPTEDGITFRIICRLTHIPTGLFVGSGVGECSTKEEKYNWRAAVCNEEYEATPEDRRREKWKAGYQGKPATSIKQVRTNPADLANTVLKMGKKRALVDGTLTALAASDCFTQDIEDMSKENLNGGKEANKKPASKPTKKADSVKPKGKAGGSGDDAKTALKKALWELCDGDHEKMNVALYEASRFEGSNGEVSIDGSEGIDKATVKWCGSTLGKIRKLIEEKKVAATQAKSEEPTEDVPGDDEPKGAGTVPEPTEEDKRDKDLENW